jgi:hypothetical protein
MDKFPKHRLRVPSEVLDPRAMIPLSKFNFRRRESEAATTSLSRGSPPDHMNLLIIQERYPMWVERIFTQV